MREEAASLREGFFEAVFGQDPLRQAPHFEPVDEEADLRYWVSFCDSNTVEATLEAVRQLSHDPDELREQMAGQGICSASFEDTPLREWVDLQTARLEQALQDKRAGRL